MPYVLDCRIFFNDLGNATNAFNHIKALAEHGSAHDQQVGARTQTSWGRVHECVANDNAGDTSGCTTLELFKIGEGGGIVDPSGETYPAWQEWTGNNEDLYSIGDRVSHVGSNWESTLDNNHWEPGGGTGWVQIG